MSDPFMGQILAVGFPFAPPGWATCDGQAMQISQNSALFSLLGTTFGGDGMKFFMLPDLRGRSPVHVGNGVTPGQAGGATSVTLTAANLPPHNHTIAVNGAVGNSDTPVNSFPAPVQGGAEQWQTAPGNGQTLAAGAVSMVGGGQPVQLRSPFLGLTHIIALDGIYPSRQ